MHNQATLSGTGLDNQTSENPGIDVPGVPAKCDRVVTICKLITQNNDGIADNIASLTFGVTGNTKSATNSVTVSNVVEGSEALREHYGAAGRQPHGY